MQGAQNLFVGDKKNKTKKNNRLTAVIDAPMCMGCEAPWYRLGDQNKWSNFHSLRVNVALKSILKMSFFFWSQYRILYDEKLSIAAESL